MKNQNSENRKETFSNNTDFDLYSPSEIESLNNEIIEEIEGFSIFNEFSDLILEQNIQEKLPIAFRLTRRFIVFLTFMMISLFTIFFIGNEQKFLDSDLKLILNLNTIVSIMLSLICVCALMECAICIFTEKKIKYFFYSIAFIIDFAFAIISAFLSRSIELISNGFFG